MSKLQSKIRKITAILMACCLLLVADAAFAARATLISDGQNIRAGAKFEVGFFLDTENEDINAIEGKVVFPKDVLELKEIRDGNSIINLWIEQPKSDNGQITFSGITPGGYYGKRGLIFSIVFQAMHAGSGFVEIQGMKVLRNDGKGTETKTDVSNLEFRVSNPDGRSKAPDPQIQPDTDPPEAFEPVIVSDAAVFEGKHFLIFAAQDKGSGIARYEVREGTGSFTVAESPYLLQNQKLDKEIAVKAIDKSGNERVVIVPAQVPSPRYQSHWIFGILMLLGIIAAWLGVRTILWIRKPRG